MCVNYYLENPKMKLTGHGGLLAIIYHNLRTHIINVCGTCMIKFGQGDQIPKKPEWFYFRFGHARPYLITSYYSMNYSVLVTFTLFSAVVRVNVKIVID